MRNGDIKKLGISKGDWIPLANTNGYNLWEVLSKEGAAHEVVTVSLFGEKIIVEVDGEKVW